MNNPSFPRTADLYSNHYDYDAKYGEQLGQVRDAFTADLIDYLEENFDPTRSLDQQAAALADLDYALPGLYDLYRPSDPEPRANRDPESDWRLSKASGEKHVSLLPVDLDAVSTAELIVAPHLDGSPVFYARHTAAGWQVTQMPTEWQDTAPVISSGSFVYLIEARDLTGDGRLDIFLRLSEMPGGNWGEPLVHILRWDGEQFTLIFAASLYWGEGRFASLDFVPNTAGQDVLLMYDDPSVVPTWGDWKRSPLPTVIQRWRWDPESGRYVPWSGKVEREDCPQWHSFNDRAFCEGVIAFHNGDCKAALEGYEAFLADEATQEWMALPDDERTSDVAVAVDHARLRAGLCYALLNEPDEARRMLNDVETESTRLLRPPSAMPMGKTPTCLPHWPPTCKPSLHTHHLPSRMLKTPPGTLLT